MFVSFYVQKKCSPAARELPCVFCKQADNSILIGKAVNDDGKNKYVARVVDKRDHCTALRAMQHPSMTPTCLLGVWGGE